jgi:hypothetical protein
MRRCRERRRNRPAKAPHPVIPEAERSAAIRDLPERVEALTRSRTGHHLVAIAAAPTINPHATAKVHAGSAKPSTTSSAVEMIGEA